MTGRQRIELAFSEQGTPEIPAVICYEGIYIRDHWDQLTSCPWWYQYSPEIEHQMRWYRDFITKTRQDWIVLPRFYSRDERKDLTIVTKKDKVFLYNRRKGTYSELNRPIISGWSAPGVVHSYHPQRLIETEKEIDESIYIPSSYDLTNGTKDGRNELALWIMDEFDLYPISHVSSPLWCTYSLWGFEGMMVMIATKPEIVKYACQRYLEQAIYGVKSASAIGCKGIWIEECMTDMISPQAFAELNLPYIRALAGEIKKAGLKSIYYYCGNPDGKWDLLLASGVDALALEESKKGFVIDIEQVVQRVQGRMVVLGNLDAINCLPYCTEDKLEEEISRQICAGLQNGRRFIMSIGSPVTPETPVDRVGLYCDLVHKLGKLG